VEVTASDHGGDQYDFSVRTPGGRVVHGGGGFCDPDTARVVGQTYLRAFC
jgi:hypothetical protein